MNLFTTVLEETKEHSRKGNRIGGVYDVSGTTQTRNGTTFIENKFSAKVDYSEDLTGADKKVFYKVANLQQSCTGLLFQFAAYFNEITANLELKINDNWEVEKIMNLSEINDQWQSEKKSLSDRFKIIPGLEGLLENYEKSIQDEERLRNSIFYTGIAQLFFPRIKQLLAPEIGSTKFQRKRNLQGFYFGILIPVKEELVIKKIGDTVYAHISGTLDFDGIEDKSYFLNALRMLYGETVELEDITYQAKEKYALSKELVYETGELEQFLEVKGVHFKKDHLSFKSL